MSKLPLSKRVMLDDDHDLLVFDGIKVAVPLLESFTEPTKEGVWFRVVKCQNGSSIIQTVQHIQETDA